MSYHDFLNTLATGQTVSVYDAHYRIVHPSRVIVSADENIIVVDMLMMDHITFTNGRAVAEAWPNLHLVPNGIMPRTADEWLGSQYIN